MHTKKIGENLFLIDLQTGGFKNLIASYVLKGRTAVIVETGPSSSIPNLFSGLRELDVKPEEVAYVAISHVHLDHGGGVGALLKLLPNAKVVVHPRGVPHLINPRKLWVQSKAVLGNVTEIYGAPKPVPKDRIIGASDGMRLNVGDNVELKITETLGHASHHLSYYESVNRGVFLGDAAGIYLSQSDVVIPTSPPPFRLDLALNSLEKLGRLNPKALYYSHFGEASDAVRRLQNYARQIKLWATIAKKGVENKQKPSAIKERILEEDEAMRRIAPFLRVHPILMKTAVENSVQGFIDWAEKSEDKLTNA